MPLDARQLLRDSTLPFWIDEGIVALAEEPYDDDGDDEAGPLSPIEAASAWAGRPDDNDLSLGGATASTALLPRGLRSIPAGALDRANVQRDHEINEEQSSVLAHVAIAGALADGDPERAVLDDLAETLRSFPGLEHFDEQSAIACVVALHDGSADGKSFLRDLEGWFEEAARTLIDPGMRRVAYQLAAYACAWDGEFTDAESEVLDALAEAFEISPSKARSLREWVLQQMSPEAWPM